MEATRRVLVVDDDEDFLVGTRMQLRGTYGVLTAKSISEALDILGKQDVDLVLLDVGLGEENGLDGIKKIHNVHPLVGVAMLSGRSDVQTIVQAIRAGAIEYLTKPLNMDFLETAFEKAVATRNVQERCEAMLRSQIIIKNGKTNLIYKSKKMQQLIEESEKVRGHDANVLIIGETGTGKELLARYINEREGNPRRPFIAVNCGAIPENLLESELFGHEAGAFTGANRRRVGKFELADGGDILLDEIDTMKLDLQVKLLRAIQEKEFFRLGSNVPIKTNFRVIAASNQSLDEMIEVGSFRMDLYHRLKVIQLVIPPLRERTDDVPELVDYFLHKFTDGSGQKKSFSRSAIAHLKEYSWPGNVRELANVVRSLVIMTKGENIDEMAFPPWVMSNHIARRTNGSSKMIRNSSLPTTAESVGALKGYVQKIEKEYILKVLELNNDDKSKAASALGIGRTTLYMKMKELGMMG